MKARFYLLYITVLLLTSCQTSEKFLDRKCAKAQRNYELAAYKYGCPWQILDSIIVRETKEIIRDTTIYVHIPGEIVHDSILVAIADSITSPVSILRTKYAISKAWIENSHLKHTLEQVKSEIQQVIQGINKETVTLKQKTIRVSYPVEKPVKYSLNNFEKFLLWSGGLAWVLAIALALFRVRRFLTFRNWFS
jgi:hypothetical protein